MSAATSITARLRAGIACCALAALLGGCAQLVPQTVALRTDWPQGVPQTVEWTGVPFFPQEDYQCGPAALATVLAWTGVHVTPQPLVDQVFLPARKGSLQLELLAAPRRYDRVSYQLAPRYGDLLREVAAGNPVIILQDVGDFSPLIPEWHYAVVNGFDYPSGTIYMRSGHYKRLKYPFTYLEREWMKSKYWAMVVTPPDRIPVTATERGWLESLNAMARVASPDAVRTGYATALARWPDNLPAAVGLANAYHQLGKTDEAVQVLRTALKKHPDSVILMNNLAQTLSDEGRQSEALAQIDKASDPKSPFAPEVQSTRALILQRIAQQKAGARP